MALALPKDRGLVEEILKIQSPGSEITARIRMRGGEACLWRGEWLEDGVRAHADDHRAGDQVRRVRTGRR